MANFLNKAWVKLIFSDAPNLNMGVRDMGADQVRVEFTENATELLDTATGFTASLNLYTKALVTVSIKKTSPVAVFYGRKYFQNSNIGGTLTLYDDVNKSYSGTSVVIHKLDLGQLNGSSPTFDITLACVLEINAEALGGAI